MSAACLDAGVDLVPTPATCWASTSRLKLAVSVTMADDQVSAIWVVRNPDKLRRLREPSPLTKPHRRGW